MQTKKHPIFNEKFEIIRSLGEGNTAKVYLARDVETGALSALKIAKEEYLNRSPDTILQIQSEITILKNLAHQNIVGLSGWGDSGKVVKPSGRVIDNLVYVMMEHVSGGLLFDLC